MVLYQQTIFCLAATKCSFFTFINKLISDTFITCTPRTVSDHQFFPNITAHANYISMNLPLIGRIHGAIVAATLAATIAPTGCRDDRAPCIRSIT